MEDEEETFSNSGDSTGFEPDYEVSPESSESNGSEYDNDGVETPATRSDPPPNHRRKSQNVAALVRGNIEVKRQSLFPRVYSVVDAEATLRKPFKPPCSIGYSENKEQLTRRLWARKRFVPWGSSSPALIHITNRFSTPNTIDNGDSEESESLPPGIEPLVLWQPEEAKDQNVEFNCITVEPLLVKFLRPHQREGVQFMFDCVSGILGAENINGCILADDMGLGKTLQSITLLYTLLRQGFDGKSMVKKAIVVTPTSLVSNWEAEIKKWVGERVKLVALCESTREDVVSGIDSFTNSRSPLQVLIISYETFRMHSSKFNQDGSCDLLICDEAHRLKNDQTLTNRALAALSCKRRILLSGTPMQNDLEEFYAMVSFTNPGVLGDASYFRRYYEMPIVCGREPTATEEEKRLGSERSAELSGKVNQFILRRTNTLLSNHLPPKIIEVVCCKMSPLQSQLYNHFIHSKNVKRAISEEAKQSKILAYITVLKKLCNHPKLVYDTIKSGSPGTSGFDDCLHFFPTAMFSGRSGSWTGGDGAWVELSGKMHVLARLLAHLRQKTDDRIVLVSNYTQTLELFAQLCRERRYPFLKLDGSTSISKRQKLVNQFNDPSKDEFVFLLSSKAGGCGLNLIGGNRLVLFDPDWNPANDKQAAARVWRDGQKKRVYIYRFLSTGTIEEKVYQRQMSKEGLQKVIQQEHVDSEMGNLLSTEDLRDLFTFFENTSSEIHEKMCCNRCRQREMMSDSSLKSECMSGGCQIDEEDIGGFAGIAGCFKSLKSHEKQVGTPKEEDLASWGHHHCPSTVPDPIFQASAGDEVSFVFTNQIGGKLTPIESTVRKIEEAEHKSLPVLKKDLSRRPILTYKNKEISPAAAISLNRDSRSSFNLKTLQQPPSKLMRTLQGKTKISLLPRTSAGIQIPSNRLSPACINDDDFQ
ncbi:DNA repair/recombination protein [Perilla frutescens var. hirtella]|nr:DNA repair/recombination protein [Perilla frutescens var. frutescens]KAH6794044.1 DNA repair/recombination protein [Perilla frutescens var. hirtella]